MVCSTSYYMGNIVPILSPDVIKKSLIRFKKRSFSNRDKRSNDLLQFQTTRLSCYNYKKFDKLRRHFKSYTAAFNYYTNNFNKYKDLYYKFNFGRDKYEINISDCFDDKVIYYKITARTFEICLSLDNEKTDEYLISISDYEELDIDVMFNLSIKYDVILLKNEDIIEIRKIMERKPKGCYTISSTDNCTTLFCD